MNTLTETQPEVKSKPLCDLIVCVQKLGGWGRSAHDADPVKWIKAPGSEQRPPREPLTWGEARGRLAGQFVYVNRRISLTEVLYLYRKAGSRPKEDGTMTVTGQGAPDPGERLLQIGYVYVLVDATADQVRVTIHRAPQRERRAGRQPDPQRDSLLFGPWIEAGDVASVTQRLRLAYNLPVITRRREMAA